MAEKSMAIALIISFFLSGLGIAYVGDVKKGVIIFAAAVICNIITRFFIYFAIVAFIVWAYGLYATYQEVKAYNGA